ncbi:MAG TPA: DUF5060 domain-containing protein [Fimbriimonas sp.]
MLTLIALTFAQSAPIVTPYAQREPLGIAGIQVVGRAERGRAVELAAEAKATFDNPFDPNDISLDAKITPPKGDAYTLPGFFSVQHRREGNDVKPGGEQGWRVRFYAPESGDYRVNLTLKDRSGTATSSETRVRVEAEPAGKGMVRLSPRDRRYFETENGGSFYPLGANLGWAGDRVLGDYQAWLPKYGAQGANWGRVWLSPAWTTFALETSGKREEGHGMGQFNQSNAARLDEALRLAAEHGVYLQLCIDSYNILRDRDAHNYWEQSPHNRENGGPLRLWTDFWTNAEMDRLYRAKLRYLVARYSAMPNVFAWEFWNEVDLTRNFDVEVARAWHERMGRAVRELDPYGHLVTTSFAGSNGFREIDLMPEIDFVQTHHYGQDPGGQAAWQQTRKGSWGKAHFLGEIGADAGGARGGEDRRGYQIHDPIWASIATGASGGAMPWWWDSYIEPLNLYPIFGAARRFIQGVDFPGEGFRQARPVVSYANPPKTPRMKDLVLSGGPISWQYSEANKPAVVRYLNGRFRGNLPLSGIQHGAVNHANLHNPVQFHFTLPRATRFEIEVGNVSGHGGAKLAVALDGHRVLTRDFRDPDGTAKTDDLTQYAGKYGLTIPAGNHTLTVENPGTDWFMVSYRLVGVVPQKTPALTAYAVTGEKTAFVWLRSEDATWRNEIVLKRTATPAPTTVLRLPGLSAGLWDVEHWNTWTGAPTRTQQVRVGVNGVMRVQLPPITRDLALKIVRK